MKFKRFQQIILIGLIALLILPVVPVFSAPTQYRTENEILQDFFNLQSSYSDVLDYEVIGETVEGKEIYLFKLGNPQGVPVLIDASIHGHEYITTEALYYCIEWILTEQTNILETNYILFNPIVNRDSYRIKRTNARGVDLNRNFPTYWQATGEGTIYYTGPEPLSEPETQAIHNTLVNYQPHWYINLHSGYSRTRITPPSTQEIYNEVYENIRDTSNNIFEVSPFPYDTYQFYEGMARYEGETQGAYTWEIEISSTTPSTNEFYGRVVPRLKAVFTETFLEGVSEPDPTPNTPPVADANGPYVGLEDTSITFSATDSFDLDDNPLYYNWNFGDGTSLTTTSDTVTHTYTTGEQEQIISYPVSLIVNDGIIDSIPDETTVTITGVNDLPIAETNGPYSAMVGEDIQFDASNSYDEEGISSYTWDFGDENIISGPEITHQYSESGTYIITLTVTDTNGATDSTSTIAEITKPNQIPVAEVNGPYDGLEDNEIIFSATGSFDPDNDPLTYIWNFGDGTTKQTTSETTTHTYTNGVAEQVTLYTVNLMVNDGHTNSQTKQITASVTGINDNPIAKTNGPYTGIINEKIRLNALESSDEEGISSYSWDFGDGNIGSGEEFTYQYSEIGTYVITLTVTDTNGATDRTSTVAEITEPEPQPSVSVTIMMSREDNTRGKSVIVSRALATITVTLEGSPMKASTVNGHWSGTVDITETGTTNGKGEVTFRTDFINNAGLFTFTIDSVQRDEINYTLQGETTNST